MDGSPNPDELRTRFRTALDAFAHDAPVLILGHHDADGLAATALLARAFRSLDRPVITRVVGRGENAWSADMTAELAPMDVGGIIVADLGAGAAPIKAATPTIVVDHHVPRTASPAATVISGYGCTPAPTTSLLAYWCAAALVPVESWLWIAALGIIGDMAQAADFEEMRRARERYPMRSLREVTALINAARRSSSADASPALALLLRAEGPEEVLCGRHPETEALRAARAEVKRELDRVRRTAPIVRNGVALLRVHSPCQIHPLLAQAWRSRLAGAIVLAANTGYRPGWVHFAARSARPVNLIEFFARHRPPGADENYGGGHERASGGALRIAEWNAFAGQLGFGPEARVEP